VSIGAAQAIRSRQPSRVWTSAARRPIFSRAGSFVLRSSWSLLIPNSYSAACGRNTRSLYRAMWQVADRQTTRIAERRNVVWGHFPVCLRSQPKWFVLACGAVLLRPVEQGSCAWLDLATENCPHTRKLLIRSRTALSLSPSKCRQARTSLASAFPRSTLRPPLMHAQRIGCKQATYTG
jgi:hypothetical protein